MKHLLTCFLLILMITSIQAQVDRNGNPTFNSIELSDDDMGQFQLTSGYYTVDNNIANKESSVYMSDRPGNDDYIKFARDLPSYFFIIHDGPNVFAMIMLLQKNEGSNTELFYNIVNPENGKSVEAPCGVWGEVSEKRADELMALKVDSNSKFIDLPNNGRGLLFNGMMYRIQPFEQLKAEVAELARQLLSAQETVDDPEAYIRKESNGGKLDFAKVLEKKEEPFFLFEGVAYNKKQFAILLWGQAVKRIGIKSSKQAQTLWEEIHGRALSKPESKALNKGFKSKLE